MVDVQTVSIAVSSASVTVAAVYYMWQIRYQTKLRQMDFIMRMPSSFIRKEAFQALATIRKTAYKNYADFKRNVASKPNK